MCQPAPVPTFLKPRRRGETPGRLPKSATRQSSSRNDTAGRLQAALESRGVPAYLLAAIVISTCSVALGGQPAAVNVPAADQPSITIDLARGTDREQRTKRTLERVLASFDLKKYTFTRRVVIEEGAINHAFPVLTLNARFAASPDELLSSYVHEQLHWHLRDRMAQQQAAIAELRGIYPRVPVGLPEGAENAYSTYGHLVTCYLEILAARELLGPERASAAIANKGNYTWIYATVRRDEKKIGAVVDRHGLRPAR